MSERVERCSRCRWWERIRLGEDPETQEEVEGSCHRYPPVLNTDYLRRSKDTESRVLEELFTIMPWFHPTTNSHDFCGEFTTLALPVV